MKKKLIAFTAVCMSMSLLAGCGSSENPKSNTDAQAESESVEEVVMYESKNVKITYIGEDESFMGYELKVKIDNLSDEKLTVQVRDVSVNNIMVDTIFSKDLTPGKTATDSITFLKSDFEDNNITDVDTVELSFHIFNTDTFETIEDTEMVTLNK